MYKLFIYLSRSCVNVLLFPAVRYSYSKLGDSGSLKAKLGENYYELGNLEAIFGALASMHACNHPSDEKKGSVGIFYKDTIPIIIRSVLSFDECIVAELRFGRKKYSLQCCIEIPCIKQVVLNFWIL